MRASRKLVRSSLSYLLTLLPAIMACQSETSAQVGAPAPTTSSVWVVTSSSALAGGTVTSGGGAAVTARGVCWSTGPTPTVADSRTTDGTGSGSYSSSLTGLQAITAYYVRAYATNNAGTGYGNVVTFTTSATADDTVSDIDGNFYRTVRVGSQLWMAENLRTTRLNDGQPIPNVTSFSDWPGLLTPGYSWYDNDPANAPRHGALYNWYAVGTGRLAPTGWHVPSADEWEVLIQYLGGDSVAGGRLKEGGFTVSGAGQRTDAVFNAPELDKYWTTTEGGWAPTDVMYRTIPTIGTFIGRSSHPKLAGHSVRCVRNE